MLLRRAFLGSGVTTYATWNPADKHADINLTGGDLTATSTTGSKGVRATIGKSSGKWYWEVMNNSGAENDIGIATASASLSTWLGADAQGVGYDSFDGKLYKNSSIVASYATYAQNDYIGFALDCDAGTIAIYKNGTLQGTYSHGLSGTIYPAMGGFASTMSGIANFGASAFTYSPPGGFNAGVYN